jgi:hypothetical protein
MVQHAFGVGDSRYEDSVLLRLVNIPKLVLDSAPRSFLLRSKTFDLNGTFGRS